MQQYFKHEAESDLGKGVAYIEFDGQWATRQVEVYGDHWLTSMEEYHPGIGPGLCDQPMSELGLGPDDRISKEEFEDIWKEALQRSSVD